MPEWKQERPEWCKFNDCIFLRRAMDSMCGGRLPQPIPHSDDVNTHRFCIVADGDLTYYQVNESDLEWLRWIFDALDGKKTSWLSRHS